MIIWTPILRIATKLTGWIQQMAAKEQLAMTKPKTKPKHKVTIIIPSQQPNNCLPPSINVSKQLGGQVGYPAHSQNAKPLDETSPKPDLVDGQDVKPQLQHLTPGLTEEEIVDRGLKEINQIVACVNQRQRNLTSADIQAEANWQLDNYLNNYDKVSPGLRELENETKIPKD